MQCFRICCQTYCISLLMFYSIVHFRISCFGKPFSTNFTGGWGRGERSSRGWVSCWPFLLCENSPHRFAYLYLIGDKWQFSTQDVCPRVLPIWPKLNQTLRSSLLCLFSARLQGKVIKSNCKYNYGIIFVCSGLLPLTLLYVGINASKKNWMYIGKHAFNAAA